MKNVEKIFKLWSEIDPEPRTELEYINEYTLLVAIVLSAQATDVSVNKATKNLFEKVDNTKKMLELGEAGLKNYIKTIGLYNSKAKNVMLLSKKLIDVYKNIIPNSLEELQSLAGVGRKTANVFLNCARGQDTIGVDTHVYRVSNRLGIINSKNVLQTEMQLLKVIPKKHHKYAHHHLILHGRYVCKARKPLCQKCNVNKYCKYILKYV